MPKTINNTITEFVHYGHDTFDAEKFMEPQNYSTVLSKPIGGLWFCAHENGELSSWQDYAARENLQEDRRPETVEDIREFNFTLKDDARVYVINSIDDAKNLVAECGYERNPDASDNGDKVPVLDWDDVKERYDVVYVSQEAMDSSEWGGSDVYNYFYGWDVESGIVLNPDAIETWKTATADEKQDVFDKFDHIYEESYGKFESIKYDTWNSPTYDSLGREVYVNLNVHVSAYRYDDDHYTCDIEVEINEDIIEKDGTVSYETPYSDSPVYSEEFPAADGVRGEELFDRCYAAAEKLVDDYKNGGSLMIDALEKDTPYTSLPDLEQDIEKNAVLEGPADTGTDRPVLEAEPEHDLTENEIPESGADTEEGYIKEDMDKSKSEDKASTENVVDWRGDGDIKEWLGEVESDAIHDMIRDILDGPDDDDKADDGDSRDGIDNGTDKDDELAGVGKDDDDPWDGVD